MSGGHAVWVEVRASEAEGAASHAKTRSAGLTLSDLIRRSVGRARPWTMAHAEVRAHPAGRARRQQSQPNHPVGEHAQVRRRKKDLPADYRRANLGKVALAVFLYRPEKRLTARSNKEKLSLPRWGHPL